MGYTLLFALPTRLEKVCLVSRFFLKFPIQLQQLTEDERQEWRGLLSRSKATSVLRILTGGSALPATRAARVSADPLMKRYHPLPAGRGDVLPTHEFRSLSAPVDPARQRPRHFLSRFWTDRSICDL